MKKEYHIIQSRYLRHVHTYRAARTYVKSCSPKNNRSNKKKTLFFFKKMASFFKNLLIFYCHRKFAIFHRGIPPSDTLFAKKKPENILLHIKSEQLIKKGYITDNK